MAAGIVYHNITTSSGVTFTIACWVPDTTAPDVGAIAVNALVNSAGTPLATGSGSNGVTVLRTALATDSPGIITTGTAGSASSQVLSIQGIASMTPVQTSLTPVTTGGLSILSTITPNNTTAVVVKSGAGQLYKVRATNNSGTIAYIKIYNATSATAGSGTPVDRIMIPAATTNGAGIVDTTDIGAAYSTGITYCLTTGIADNDTGAPAASTYLVTFYYK